MARLAKPSLIVKNVLQVYSKFIVETLIILDKITHQWNCIFK